MNFNLLFAIPTIENKNYFKRSFLTFLLNYVDKVHDFSKLEEHEVGYIRDYAENDPEGLLFLYFRELLADKDNNDLEKKRKFDFFIKQRDLIPEKSLEYFPDIDPIVLWSLIKDIKFLNQSKLEDLFAVRNLDNIFLYLENSKSKFVVNEESDIIEVLEIF